MKSSLRKLLSLAFLLLTLGIVLYIGFNDNDIPSLWGALKKLSPIFLGGCLAGWAGYMFMDALTVYSFLRSQDHPISLWDSIKVAIIGVYYSNITPSASGGQPMQMYYLSQRKVPLGVSGSALTIKFFCFQLMLLVVGAVLWATHWEYVFAQTNGLIWFIVLGYVMNFFSIGILFVMAVSPNAMRGIIRLCIRIGAKLHICKNVEKSTAKWNAHCDSFLESVQLIRKNPAQLGLQFLIALMQLLFLMSVTIILYHAFGLTGTSTLQLLTMAVLLYITASYTPLPGASGAQEGGFAFYFQGIFPAPVLFVALLLWRFFTYYLSLLVGVCFSFYDSIAGLYQKRKETAGIPEKEPSKGTNS